MRTVSMVDFDQLQAAESSDPSVEGPFDVLIRIAGAGVCRTDLHTLEGRLKDVIGPPRMPYILGHENAGWVEAVGRAVQHVKVGDPVVLHPWITCGVCGACRSGNDMHCTSSAFPGVDGVTPGGFAERMLTHARAVVPLPAGSDPVRAASLGDAGLTAYHAVKRILPLLGPGTSTVMIGMGGVGQFGVQLLKLLSVTNVTVLDVEEGRLGWAQELGADKVSLSQDGDAPVEEVLDQTSGGADVVLDFVGAGETPADAIRMVRKGGVYSIVGYGGELTLSTLEATVRELTVMGNLVGTYNELVELVGLWARGDIKSRDVLYDFSQAEEVMHRLGSGDVVGRAILVPSQ